MPSTTWLLTSALLTALTAASPAPTPVPAPVVVGHPMITAAAVAPLDIQRRQILDSLTSKLGSAASNLESAAAGAIKSVISGFGSDLPTSLTSLVGSGALALAVPTASAVRSSLGLSDDDVDALPTQVLNLGPYANWTNQGWNMLLHGNVYKTPNISESKLNDLADAFLIGTKMSQLSGPQQTQARNLTAEIFVLQQGGVQPIFSLVPTPTQGGAQVIQTIIAPYNTTVEGDYMAFIPINSTGLTLGNATDQIQEVPIYANGSLDGNATAYFVPSTGVTIVSDIDDILRVTKIYEPAQGILNTFANPFTPWMNMPEIYANWSKSLLHPQVHFHYLTTTPEQITRNYEAFISANYPPGSFDTRPLNFSDVSATLSIRQYLLTRVFETFPQRKFVLVADTSNSDVMRDYPKLAHTYPDQVACIFLRNTSATDSGDRFPYDTSGFAGLNQSQFMFFVTPDDLMGLDISNGQCYNSSVQQNVTFGYQGLPLDLSGDGNFNYTASSMSASSAAAASSTSSVSAASASATKTGAAARGFAIGVVAWGVMIACVMGVLVLV